jgi:hypothetical protein
MTRPNDHPSALVANLEARMGARLAAGLNERAAHVPHDIAERLRVAREQAVLRARAQRQGRLVGAGASVRPAGRGTLGFGGGRFWLGLASWVPLAVLIGGLVLIQQRTDEERVLAAAEIDAVLLADNLPPAAWSDPGFREYMKAPHP